MSRGLVPSLTLLTLIATGTLYAGGSMAQAKDCSAIKGASARLACYDASSRKHPAQPVRVGSIEGTITWQYNKFVGTKGDVGAKVILVRSPVADSLQRLGDPERAGLTLGVVMSEQPGVIYGIAVDGFGHFAREGLASGDYKAYVISGQTTPSPDDNYTNSCAEDLKLFKTHTIYCTSVTITPGSKTELVHDFGNTYS